MRRSENSVVWMHARRWCRLNLHSLSLLVVWPAPEVAALLAATRPLLPLLLRAAATPPLLAGGAPSSPVKGRAAVLPGPLPLLLPPLAILLPRPALPLPVLLVVWLPPAGLRAPPLSGATLQHRSRLLLQLQLLLPELLQ